MKFTETELTIRHGNYEKQTEQMLFTEMDGTIKDQWDHQRSVVTCNIIEIGNDLTLKWASNIDAPVLVVNVVIVILTLPGCELHKDNLNAFNHMETF